MVHIHAHPRHAMHPWPSKARHGEGLGWVWFADAANSWRMSSASASTCAVAHRTAKPKMVVVAMRCDVQRYDTSCHCASVLEWHSCADRRAYVSLLRVGCAAIHSRPAAGHWDGAVGPAVVFGALQPTNCCEYWIFAAEHGCEMLYAIT